MPPTLSSQAAYAEVIVPRHLYRSFTYRIPSWLTGRVQVGNWVRVPLGPSAVQGLVVALSSQPPALGAGQPGQARLREIAELLDESPESGLEPDLLVLTRLVSERYLAPWGQCLRLVQPSSRARRLSVRIVLTESGREIARRLEGPSSIDGGELARIPLPARELLKRLAQAPKGLTLAHLRRSVERPEGRALLVLRRRGWAGERRVSGPDRPSASAPQRQRVPAAGHLLPSPTALDRLAALPDPGTMWGHRLRVALERKEHAAFLVWAPAAERLASLLQATHETLLRHRTVLLITPEIDRASAIAALARHRWGERVELLHSALSPSARAEAWRRIRASSGCVVVGTRSSVFAPAGSLGLIWVEEEEDPALKEEGEPRYHAREVAWMRARQGNAVLVLGSAHPSVETMVRTSGPTADLHLLEACGGADLTPASPTIEVLDSRRLPFGALLSQPLIEGIETALATGSGRLAVILFLNRRGYASALLCRDCGHAPRCGQCSVTLTFYKGAGRLSCRYCGASEPVPGMCPACLAPRLQPVGIGSERIEAEVRRLFPRARVGRLDRDAARTVAQAEAIRRQAWMGELDILVGTQLLFQGSPLPHAKLVGLPHADAGLHLPDFRAAERTYHTLREAVNLGHPAESGGRVLLQTYLPTHHAITAIAAQSPALFYDQELAFRRALGYPPFAHLIGLRVSGKDAGRVKEAAVRWAGMLRAAIPEAAERDPTSVQILGPIPAAVSRLRGRHRWQLLVKSVNGEVGRQTVRTTLVQLEGKRGMRGLKFEVDVDPVETG